jgi:GAF domain-containing protein
MAAIVAALSRYGPAGLAALPADRNCAGVLGVTGVTVTVLVAGGTGEVVWRTGAGSTRLDDLQFTLGEGPAVDAAASGGLVLEPDLTAVPAHRWPVFTHAALDLGVRAVFAVPLQIGAVCLGVLLAHRDTPGRLKGGGLADMLAFAEAAAHALLGHGSGVAGEPEWLSGQPAGYRAQIHQATGMMSVQLGLTQADALLRMRGYAFSHRLALADVAANVVSRQLRFDSNTE